MNEYCPKCGALLEFYQCPDRKCACGWRGDYQRAITYPKLTTIKAIMSDSYRTWIEKGWEENINFPEQCMLIVTELAEAVEEYRISGITTAIGLDDKKPVGIAVELADAVLRIFNLCSHFDLPLEDAIARKAVYNKTRSYKHGNKLV